MIVKTLIDNYDGINIKDYVNVPVFDRFTSVLDFENMVITGHDKSKIIGVVTNAKQVANRVELTIKLYTRISHMQLETTVDENGNEKPTSLAFGFEDIFYED